MTAPAADHDLRDLREQFGFYCSLSTRWNDNDLYGHINNAVYYEYFDTAANCYLIEKGGLDIQRATVVGVVVESMCRYRRPLAFPAQLDVGVRVNALRTRSVEYGIGVFAQGAARAAAVGYFCHVFVDRDSLQPVPIPTPLRAALELI